MPSRRRKRRRRDWKQLLGHGSPPKRWNSAAPRYETPAHTAIQFTHFAVAGFQISLLHQGIRPSVRHPFVPSDLFDSVPEVSTS